MSLVSYFLKKECFLDFLVSYVEKFVSNESKINESFLLRALLKRKGLRVTPDVEVNQMTGSLGCQKIPPQK